MSSEKKERDRRESRSFLLSGKDHGNKEDQKSGGKPRKIITMVISLVAAIAFWVYVMEEVNPQINRTFTDIPVRIMNEESLPSRNLAAITTEDELFVKVRVSGKRRVLMHMESADFLATANASDCVRGENYLSVKVHKMPAVEIEKITPSQIEYDVESIVTENKPVRVVYTGEPDSGYQAVTLRQDLDTVAVTGVESAVNRIKEVRSSVEIEDLTDTAKSIQVQLTAVDKRGREITGIQLEKKKISISSQIYLQKEVTLDTSYSGNAAEGYKVVSFQAPDTVKIALPSDEADGVVSVSAEPVDLSSLKKSETLDLVLNLPGNAVLADGQETPQAEVKVEKAAKGESADSGSSTINLAMIPEAG